jgi:type I restriction enzyme M protein
MASAEKMDCIDLTTLESHLWEAANILRGPVDASDFKTFIFPLLFFKRISDVYDEEYEQALQESGGDIAYAQFVENHRFQIPEGCHWRDVRSKSTNIGQAIQRAMREIEKANPNTLYGIFGDAPWSNKDRLSDALLRDLIEHFSRITLANRDINDDILGQAYEYLIKKFADQTNRKAGEFYTPRSVVRLMVKILDPKEGETIYDPTCGTAGSSWGPFSTSRNRAATSASCGASSTARKRTSPRPPSPESICFSTASRIFRSFGATPCVIRRSSLATAWPRSTA